MLLSYTAEIIKQICRLCELYRTDILHFGRCRQLCHRDILFFTKQLSYSVVCIGIIAPFRKRCTIIIACNRRLIAFLMIRTCGKTEVSPAEEHIQIKGSSLLKELFKLRDQIIRFSCMMLFSPMIKPTAPEFHTHLRDFSVRL